jgi:ubiquinone biosynthesis protein UbiJ
MATNGRERVLAAIAATERIMGSIRSAARRMERLEADVMTNEEGVLIDPQDIAAYCETVGDDLTQAARLIRETGWPLESDYYGDGGVDIPA